MEKTIRIVYHKSRVLKFKNEWLKIRKALEHLN